MLELRLKALEHFMARPLPKWGPDLSALDEWIKGQDNDVSRPEAVRRLLAQALQKKR